MNIITIIRSFFLKIVSKLNAMGKSNSHSRRIEQRLKPPEKGRVSAASTTDRNLTRPGKSEIQKASLNKINQIIIDSSDLDEMLDEILRQIQKAFQCDRVWIANFVINQNRFQIMNEYTLPEWPGALETNKKIAMSRPAISRIREIADKGDIMFLDHAAVRKFEDDTGHTYGMKSMMIAPVYADSKVIWLFGLQQCSAEKVWTEAEQDFFKQLGQRVTDGLNNMLLHRELNRAKNYIDSVINSMPSVLIGINSKLEINGLNLKAENSTQVKFADAEGKKLHLVFPHLKPYFGKIRQALKEKRVVELNKIPRQINQNLCYENITIYPLIQRKVREAVIRIDEVTDHVRLETIMIQSEKMLTVGGLAAGMAHEINNPLAGMMQNAQVVGNRLLKDFPANHAAALEAGITMDDIRSYLTKRNIPRMLENINEAGRNAAKIVKNMLYFAREGVGTRDYHDLAGIIDATIDLARYDYNLKKKYDFKNIEIVREYTSDVPKIMCEASMIQQVILNILKNGTEAMSEKFARDCDRVKPRFNIRLFKEDQMVCIIIKDNGQGMTDEVLKHACDPFFTTKGPDKGTGLGLSVSYFIIVENHKGEIAIESTLGVGSSFIIKLPVT